MTTILLAEDNNELRKLMRIHLRRAGYTVLEAENGAVALELIEHNSVQLIIADIMMPIMDGYQLTEELRGADYKLPVLIISARDTIDDKRRGFTTGADDYLTKPFDMDEMILRVEALLRRSNMLEQTILRVGGCSLNEETLEISDDSFTVPLRQKEFRLLHRLLSYPGKIFTRQALMDEIWGYDSETDPRTVDTHIKRLREKTEPFSAFEIQTIRGLGYKAVIRS